VKTSKACQMTGKRHCTRLLVKPERKVGTLFREEKSVLMPFSSFFVWWPSIGPKGDAATRACNPVYTDSGGERERKRESERERESKRKGGSVMEWAWKVDEERMGCSVFLWSQRERVTHAGVGGIAMWYGGLQKRKGWLFKCYFYWDCVFSGGGTDSIARQHRISSMAKEVFFGHRS
jgi:hypothetical protein